MDRKHPPRPPWPQTPEHMVTGLVGMPSAHTCCDGHLASLCFVVVGVFPGGEGCGVKAAVQPRVGVCSTCGDSRSKSWGLLLSSEAVPGWGRWEPLLSLSWGLSGRGLCHHQKARVGPGHPPAMWGSGGAQASASAPPPLGSPLPDANPSFSGLPNTLLGNPHPQLSGLQMLLRLTSCRGVWRVVGRVESCGAWTEVWGEGHGVGRPRVSSTCADCRGGLTPHLCRRRGSSSASPLSQVSGGHSGV